ncbi:hypothetical protein [Paraburkholderia acidiphila]|uniref:Uncharacterized protein n=1 Tax=Paraburkholderia acidiphila TaxID=2571747 RepID=A0A7Z2JCF1_9BURK|nr:hypothetical protein [Paraburkholderia acidiphila]QGZ60022.1 hypothetical protein FAZ97_34430 [Paraburkholderia acidiphila]
MHAIRSQILLSLRDQPGSTGKTAHIPALFHESKRSRFVENTGHSQICGYFKRAPAGASQTSMSKKER